MLPFDYLFYRTVALFLQQKQHDLARLRGALVVSIYHTWLIFIFVVIPIDWLRITNVPIASKNSAVAIGVIMIACNAFRYFKVETFEKLSERWNDEPVLQRKIRTRLLISALIAIPVAMFVEMAIVRR